jgi:hypothetical protein
MLYLLICTWIIFGGIIYFSIKVGENIVINFLNHISKLEDRIKAGNVSEYLDIRAQANPIISAFDQTKQSDEVDIYEDTDKFFEEIRKANDKKSKIKKDYNSGQ